MGWSSGSDLFESVAKVIKEHVPDFDMRVAMYRDIIPAFEDADWDTMDEAVGCDPAYDHVFAEMFPDEDEE